MFTPTNAAFYPSAGPQLQIICNGWPVKSPRGSTPAGLANYFTNNIWRARLIALFKRR
jgi:hypothetical protein